MSDDVRKLRIQRFSQTNTPIIDNKSNIIGYKIDTNGNDKPSTSSPQSSSGQKSNGDDESKHVPIDTKQES